MNVKNATNPTNVIRGESGRFLMIDAGARTALPFQASPDDLRDYIGGKGLALRMIRERLGGRLAGIDPLGPENILAFTTGVFMGTGAPCSARFAGVTVSPLTGIMVASSCGGPFGMALKTAGWDGILITGAAAELSILVIDENGATFETAGTLRGLGTEAAQAALTREPRSGALVIGPAGENLVSYANIRSGHRYLGRGGMGAVMGSKNIKAIVASGGAYKIEAADPAAFKRLSKTARERIDRNGFTRSYRAYGTNYSVDPGVDKGYAPVRNFRERTDERCRALSGKVMAERYRTSHAVCNPCAVLCGHKGTYPDGKVRHIPEYETIGLWGGNILNFDPDLVGEWNDLMNDLGLDTISCGGTVAWAMEAAEKGLRPSVLAFGRADNIASTIADIAWRRGEGAELALGSRELSRRYGGAEFAAQVKGLEMAAYDPRAGWGMGLNYAVANRGGCHLNAYPIAMEAIFNYLPAYTTRSKAGWVAYFEDLFDAVNSVQTCQFTVFGYLLEPPMVKMLPHWALRMAMTWVPGIARAALDLRALSGQVSAITGRKVSQRALLLAGRRTHVLERLMNIDRGITAADDTLPGRFLTEAETAHHVKSVVPVEKLVRQYYRKKGYDTAGIPGARLLASLGIVAATGSAATGATGRKA